MRFIINYKGHPQHPGGGNGTNGIGNRSSRRMHLYMLLAVAYSISFDRYSRWQNLTLQKRIGTSTAAFGPKQEASPGKSPSLSQVHLLLPAFPGGFEELRITTLRSLLFFWPRKDLNLVIVLDEKVPDHQRQEEVLSSFFPNVSFVHGHNPLTVKYNPQDSMERYLQGWIVQQEIMFWADNFTDAPYIGLLDDDVAFTRHVLPYDIFDEQGRPRVLTKYFTGNVGPTNSWFRDSYFAHGNTTSYLNAMSYFPVVVKREHFAAIRQGILKHHPQHGCFDDFLSALAHKTKFSQFVIMFDYLWREHRDEYSWHFEPNTLKGPFYPNGIPKNSTFSKKLNHIQAGSPEENGVTMEMQKPFPRCAMHTSYLAIPRLRLRRNRNELMHLYMRQGYCLSQPLSFHTLENGTKVGIADDPRCANMSLWNDLVEDNEWLFDSKDFGLLWPAVDPDGALLAHQQRMMQNVHRVGDEAWDRDELSRLFPEHNVEK